MIWLAFWLALCRGQPGFKIQVRQSSFALRLFSVAVGGGRRTTTTRRRRRADDDGARAQEKCSTTQLLCSRGSDIPYQCNDFPRDSVIILSATDTGSGLWRFSSELLHRTDRLGFRSLHRHLHFAGRHVATQSKCVGSLRETGQRHHRRRCVAAVRAARRLVIAVGRGPIRRRQAAQLLHDAVAGQRDEQRDVRDHAGATDRLDANRAERAEPRQPVHRWRL